MMLVVANLRVGGFCERIAEWAIERLHPPHPLPTVVFTSGRLSAFLVNDIVWLVMTPFVVHMTQRLRLPPVPYVVAVATASNLGSAATIRWKPADYRLGREHHRGGERAAAEGVHVGFGDYFRNALGGLMETRSVNCSP